MKDANYMMIIYRFSPLPVNIGSNTHIHILPSSLITSLVYSSTAHVLLKKKTTKNTRKHRPFHHKPIANPLLHICSVKSPVWRRKGSVRCISCDRSSSALPDIVILHLQIYPSFACVSLSRLHSVSVFFYKGIVVSVLRKVCEKFGSVIPFG